jgi:hypothetical protein
LTHKRSGQRLKVLVAVPVGNNRAVPVGFQARKN